jgi:aryl-alcohol dehydrogenase-like predicted oxidoreductase
MKRLGVEQLTGLTFHSSEDFLINPKVSLSLVEELRTLGIIKTWGVSVYDPIEVEAVYDIETPDYIQAPVNLADRRFVEGKLSAEFKKKNIALHARSLYLQGIILQDPTMLPDRFLPWKSLFVSYQKLAASTNTSILVLALQSVLFLDEVDRVVVGVNSRDQLIETSLASENRLAIPGFQDIQHSDDLLLIDPRTWTNTQS